MDDWLLSPSGSRTGKVREPLCALHSYFLYFFYARCVYFTCMLHVECTLVACFLHVLCMQTDIHFAYVACMLHACILHVPAGVHKLKEVHPRLHPWDVDRNHVGIELQQHLAWPHGAARTKQDKVLIRQVNRPSASHQLDERGSRTWLDNAPVHMSKQISTPIYTRVNMLIHTSLHMSVLKSIRIFIRMPTHLSIHISMRLSMHMSVHVNTHACTHVYTHAHAYFYAHVHAMSVHTVPPIPRAAARDGARSDSRRARR